ncbi:beta-glucosidase [Halobaculum sp. P14]|uniref:beta-glucosidase family protein n=1 Tax=Halobaculum sp. P14 TaxID=3421638 RepID=UPI003EB86A60
METASADIGKLLQELTLDEKIRLVHGASDPSGAATGYLPGVERLGIPELRLADGPLGVRSHGEPATAFPASIALAATFDPELAQRQGAAMGREARERNIDALLGPGVNLIRVPHCGRNFEYYSEDPMLTSAFAASMVEGIQSTDVIATPKHYVANNQETQRASIDVDVSEAALRECYLPGFKAAVDAGSGSVMTGYNGVNGTPMSEHRRLLLDVLKGEWGFDGYVVSDWFGTKSTVGSANGGLDLEMPGIDREEMWEAFGIEESDDGVFGEDEDLSEGMPDTGRSGLFAEPLAEAVESGDVPESRLDDMVERVLRQMSRIGLLGGGRSSHQADEAAHRTLAKRIAARGTVLLKNEDVLPLSDDADVAVIGPGIHEAKTGGGGSSEIEALNAVSAVDGIRGRADGDVSDARGVPEIDQVSFFGGGEDERGSDVGPEPSIEAAVDAASAADVSVVVVQDAATEAADRDSLQLPGDQDELVEAVADASARTVVVVQSSGPVELPWRDDVDAVLESWYPGQSDGDALATVLFGDADPGGRLPVTFAAESEYPTDGAAAFPGRDGTVEYDEGYFVGYRHFDANDAEAAYPFGHGLSYGTFAYRSVDVVDDRRVQVTLENTAERAGREVIQVYASPAESTGAKRPPRELAGFESVHVPAGETVTATVDLDDLAFRGYDDGWTELEGPFELAVGRSAEDVRLSTEL